VKVVNVAKNTPHFVWRKKNKLRILGIGLIVGGYSFSEGELYFCELTTKEKHSF